MIYIQFCTRSKQSTPLQNSHKNVITTCRLLETLYVQITCLESNLSLTDLVPFFNHTNTRQRSDHCKSDHIIGHYSDRATRPTSLSVELMPNMTVCNKPLYLTHSITYTVFNTLYIKHCMSQNGFNTLYHIQCIQRTTLRTVFSTLYHIHCIQYTVPYTL